MLKFSKFFFVRDFVKKIGKILNLLNQKFFNLIKSFKNNISFQGSIMVLKKVFSSILFFIIKSFTSLKLNLYSELIEINICLKYLLKYSQISQVLLSRDEFVTILYLL